MPSLRCRVPDPLRLLIERADAAADGASGSTLSKQVKHRLALALAKPVDSSDLQSSPPLLPATSSVVFLSAEQHALLQDLAAARGWSTAQAAEALLWTDAQPELAQRSPRDADPLPEQAAPMHAVNERLSATPRPEQERYFAALDAFVMAGVGDRPGEASAGGVLFAEASTGVGKTRAFLTAVIHWVGEHPQETAAIAVPTYDLVTQVVMEWRGMAAVGPMPPMRVVLGQAAFVSRGALETWLESTPDPDAQTRVRAWIAAGGPGKPGSVLGDVAWTQEGLAHVFEGDFEDAADVGLDSRLDDQDPGYLTYQQQLAAAKAAAAPGTVLLMTHAMLGVLVRDRMRAARSTLGAQGSETLQERVIQWLGISPGEREGRLHEVINATLAEWADDDASGIGRLGLLVVDEAHELERWFASISSMQLSVWRVLQLIAAVRQRHSKLPASLLSRGHVVFDAMRALHGAEPSGEQALAQIGSLREVLADVVAALPKSGRDTREGRRLASIVRMLDVALRPGRMAQQVPALMRVRLDWSEGRHWPRVVVGRKNVDSLLEFLWSHVAHRSVLVSATLYDELPHLSAETMRSVMAVPRPLMRTMTPVRPAWIFSPVTLYAAGLSYRADGLPRFVRPKRSETPEFERTYAAWADEVAAYIALATTSAVGGGLVLLTSYADLAALQERLAQRMDASRLLCQAPGKGIARLRAAFLEMAEPGRPGPLMLGVGSVWTGLNLHSPTNPDVLTDLIIPVAPFGVARSVTQEERERYSMAMVAWAAAMVLRQGTGRLVREPGLAPNRRIHFLDARRYLPGGQGLYAPMSRWLAKYSKSLVV